MDASANGAAMSLPTATRQAFRGGVYQRQEPVSPPRIPQQTQRRNRAMSTGVRFAIEERHAREAEEEEMRELARGLQRKNDEKDSTNSLVATGEGAAADRSAPSEIASRWSQWLMHHIGVLGDAIVDSIRCRNRPRVFHDRAADILYVGDEKYGGVSLLYFPLDHYLRRGAIMLLNDFWYMRLTVLLIFIHSISILFQDGAREAFDEDATLWNSAFLVLERIITIFFLLEFMLVVLANGMRRSLQNIFTVLDVLVIIVAVLLDVVPVESPATLYILILNSLRPVRLIRRIPAMKKLVLVVVSAMPTMVSVFILLFVIGFIFSMTGVILFSEVLHNRCVELNDNGAVDGDAEFENVCRAARDRWDALFTQCEDDLTCVGGAPPPDEWRQFDHVGFALLSVVQIVTLDDWSFIALDVMDGWSTFAALYFIVLTIVGNFWALNLLLAVITDSVSRFFAEEQVEIEQRSALAGKPAISGALLGELGKDEYDPIAEAARDEQRRRAVEAEEDEERAAATTVGERKEHRMGRSRGTAPVVKRQWQRWVSGLSVASMRSLKTGLVSVDVDSHASAFDEQQRIEAKAARARSRSLGGSVLTAGALERTVTTLAETGDTGDSGEVGDAFSCDGIAIDPTELVLENTLLARARGLQERARLQRLFDWRRSVALQEQEEEAAQGPRRTAHALDDDAYRHHQQQMLHVPLLLEDVEELDSESARSSFIEMGEPLSVHERAQQLRRQHEDALRRSKRAALFRRNRLQLFGNDGSNELVEDEEIDDLIATLLDNRERVGGGLFGRYATVHEAERKDALFEKMRLLDHELQRREDEERGFFSTQLRTISSATRTAIELAAKQRPRAVITVALRTPLYDRALMGAVLLNAALQIVVHFNQPAAVTIGLHVICGLVDVAVVGDCAARLFLAGPRKFFSVVSRNVYNWMEFVVVLMCAIDLSLVVTGVVPILACMRVLRCLKYMKRFALLRRIIAIMRSSFEYTAQILGLLFIFCIVGAVCGRFLFEGAMEDRLNVCGQHVTEIDCNVEEFCVFVNTTEWLEMPFDYYDELKDATLDELEGADDGGDDDEDKEDVPVDNSVGTGLGALRSLGIKATALQPLPSASPARSMVLWGLRGRHAARRVPMARRKRKAIRTRLAIRRRQRARGASPRPPQTNVRTRPTQRAAAQRDRLDAALAASVVGIAPNASQRRMLLQEQDGSKQTVSRSMSPSASNETSQAPAKPHGVYTCRQFAGWDEAEATDRMTFDDFFLAFITICSLITLDNWSTIMHQHMTEHSPWSAIFFLLVVGIGAYVITPLLVSILLVNFGRNDLTARNLGDDDEADDPLDLLIDPETRALEKVNRMVAEEDKRAKEEYIAKLSAAEVTPLRSDGEAQTAVGGKLPGKLFRKVPKAASADGGGARENVEEKPPSGKVHMFCVAAASLFARAARKVRDAILNLSDAEDQRIDLADLHGTSFFFFNKYNKFRRACACAVRGDFFPFERVTFLFTLLHVLVSPLNSATLGNQVALLGCRVLDHTLVLTTVVEYMVRLIAIGAVLGPHSFLRTSDVGKRFDAAAVCLSVLSALVELLIPVKGLQAFAFALRSVRTFRLIPRSRAMSNVLRAVWTILPAMLNVLGLSGAVYLITSIFLTELWQGRLRVCNDGSDRNFTECVGDWRGFAEDGIFIMPDSNESSRLIAREWKNMHQYHFDNAFTAFSTLMEVSMVSDWTSPLFSMLDSPRNLGEAPVRNVNRGTAWFFVFWVFLSFLCLVNIFTGTVVDQFSRLGQKMSGSVFLTEEQSEVAHIKKLLHQSRAKKVLSVPLIPFLSHQLNVVCHKIANTAAFRHLMRFAVVFNCAIIMTVHYQQPELFHELQFWGNVAVSTLFTFEMLTKIGISGPKAYIAIGFHRLDTLIVMESWVEIVLFLTTPSYRNSQALQLFRLLRVLRVVREQKGFRRLLHAGYRALPAMANVGALLAVAYYTFGMVGVALFENIRLERPDRDFLSTHHNFRTLPNAMLTLYRAATLDEEGTLNFACGLSEPFCSKELGNCGSKTVSRIYFNTFIVTCALVMLNLFVAVVLENFSESVLLPTYMHERMQDVNLFRSVWASFDPAGRQVISAAAFVKVLLNLPGPRKRLQQLQRSGEAKDSDSVCSWTLDEMEYYAAHCAVGLQGEARASVIPTLRQLDLFVTMPRQEVLFADAIDAIGEKIFHVKLVDRRATHMHDRARESAAEYQHQWHIVEHYAACVIQAGWRRHAEIQRDPALRAKALRSSKWDEVLVPILQQVWAHHAEGVFDKDGTTEEERARFRKMVRGHRRKEKGAEGAADTASPTAGAAAGEGTGAQAPGSPASPTGGGHGGGGGATLPTISMSTATTAGAATAAATVGAGAGAAEASSPRHIKQKLTLADALAAKMVQVDEEEEAPEDLTWMTAIEDAATEGSSDAPSSDDDAQWMTDDAWRYRREERSRRVAEVDSKYRRLLGPQAQELLRASLTEEHQQQPQQQRLLIEEYRRERRAAERHVTFVLPLQFGADGELTQLPPLSQVIQRRRKQLAVELGGLSRLDSDGTFHGVPLSVAVSRLPHNQNSNLPFYGRYRRRWKPQPQPPHSETIPFEQWKEEQRALKLHAKNLGVRRTELVTLMDLAPGVLRATADDTLSNFSFGGVSIGAATAAHDAIEPADSALAVQSEAADGKIRPRGRLRAAATAMANAQKLLLTRKVSKDAIRELEEGNGDGAQAMGADEWAFGSGLSKGSNMAADGAKRLGRALAGGASAVGKQLKSRLRMIAALSGASGETGLKKSAKRTAGTNTAAAGKNERPLSPGAHAHQGDARSTSPRLESPQLTSPTVAATSSRPLPSALSLPAAAVASSPCSDTSNYSSAASDDEQEEEDTLARLPSIAELIAMRRLVTAHRLQDVLPSGILRGSSGSSDEKELDGEEQDDGRGDDDADEGDSCDDGVGGGDNDKLDGALSAHASSGQRRHPAPTESLSRRRRRAMADLPPTSYIPFMPAHEAARYSGRRHSTASGRRLPGGALPPLPTCVAPDGRIAAVLARKSGSSALAGESGSSSGGAGGSGSGAGSPSRSAMRWGGDALDATTPLRSLRGLANEGSVAHPLPRFPDRPPPPRPPLPHSSRRREGDLLNRPGVAWDLDPTSDSHSLVSSAAARAPPSATVASSSSAAAAPSGIPPALQAAAQRAAVGEQVRAAPDLPQAPPPPSPRARTRGRAFVDPTVPGAPLQRTTATAPAAPAAIAAAHVVAPSADRPAALDTIPRRRPFDASDL